MKNNYFYNENEQEFPLSLDPKKEENPAPKDPKDNPTDPIETNGDSNGDGGDGN